MSFSVGPPIDSLVIHRIVHSAAYLWTILDRLTEGPPAYRADRNVMGRSTGDPL
jgi:hypothetical protein